MKFNTLIRRSLAAATSLALGLGTVACSRDYTAAYVYAVSAQTGSVSAYGVDYQSGILTQLSGSPFGSNCGNAVSIVAAPNNKYVYEICGTQTSQIQPYTVGTDGKLYAGHASNITGSFPTAAAVDPSGAFLYVTFQFAAPYTTASPGPGGVTILPISAADGSLGTPVTVNGLNYVPVGNNPVGVFVAQPICAPNAVISANPTCSGSQGAGHVNQFVYVVDQEGSTFSPGAKPTVMGFAENTTTGALTLLSGTVFNAALKTYQNASGYSAGVTPSAIVVDPTSRFVYVTDKSANQIIGYQIDQYATGNLTPLVSSPYNTGLYPVSITIDPRGKYMYTANYNSNTVSAFAISTANGSLSGTGTGNFSVSTGPTCVTIEPALGIYMYVSNYLDSSVSAAQLQPNTGQLQAVANTPFTSSPLPICAVAVANGSHASSFVNP